MDGDTTAVICLRGTSVSPGLARGPLIVVCASGGARMQEGVLSLMQMAKTSAAIGQLRQAAVPYISILTDPDANGRFTKKTIFFEDGLFYLRYCRTNIPALNCRETHS